MDDVRRAGEMQLLVFKEGDRVKYPPERGKRSTSEVVVIKIMLTDDQTTFLVSTYLFINIIVTT